MSKKAKIEVKSRVRAGLAGVNHNQAERVRVRSGIRAGLAGNNHNATRAR